MSAKCQKRTLGCSAERPDASLDTNHAEAGPSWSISANASRCSSPAEYGRQKAAVVHADLRRDIAIHQIVHAHN